MGSRSSDMDTFFILDLVKQKKEEARRRKQDDKINEMASKMREDRSKQSSQSYNVSYGGFVGIENLSKGSSTPKSIRRHNRSKDDERSEGTQEHPLDRADLLIMGMIRDEKEKKMHELHQVYDEMAAVPSEERWSEKYEN
ncbi:unnamed protein product [Lepeophtheirus salmonis]|uniref:(salmon louse) hypothetical protein n=1 Tax=Lepeophtheirus salmonis TaxID=72036 RepID=A0A0K2UIP0_LEPSM|nr:uncharacterized protein LOC121131949 [Lepeophtheirus salmonis]CAB4055805.1 unnamed protein product [Lepeophtheirus salmonis]CAF2781465.1 unnamed protein product [Lepeophtheirus salmonis]